MNGITDSTMTDQILLLNRLRSAWAMFCEACDLTPIYHETALEQVDHMRSVMLSTNRSRVRAFLACVDAEIREMLDVRSWAGGILAGIDFSPMPKRKAKKSKAKRKAVKR